MPEGFVSVKRGFEIFDHTADVGVVAYGDDVAEAFANAARGLFSLITEPGSIRGITWRDTELAAPDEESLLVDWLNELIYLFDVEKLVFRRFEVDIFPGFRLKAKSYGERVDKNKHPLKTGVKAATYHMLKIERGEKCRVKVIFDI